jgi:hypothetical protein
VWCHGRRWAPRRSCERPRDSRTDRRRERPRRTVAGRDRRSCSGRQAGISVPADRTPALDEPQSSSATADLTPAPSMRCGSVVWSQWGARSSSHWRAAAAQQARSDCFTNPGVCVAPRRWRIALRVACPQHCRGRFASAWCGSFPARNTSPASAAVCGAERDPVRDSIGRMPRRGHSRRLGRRAAIAREKPVRSPCRAPALRAVAPVRFRCGQRRSGRGPA